MKKFFSVLLFLFIIFSTVYGGINCELEYLEKEVGIGRVEASGNWDQFLINEYFLLINNMWATETNTEQTIFVIEDGRYGWEWSRARSGESNPNYPELILGVKPWGAEEFTMEALPLQLNEIESLYMEIDLDYEIIKDQGEWNLAFELWLTADKPGGNVSSSITDEIMIWFDWSDGLWEWSDPVDRDALWDGYNMYEYNVSKGNWGSGWHYSQFRIHNKGTIPELVNLKPFLDYIQDKLGISEDIWLGALEFGMEYGDNTAGKTIINSLNYQINGQRFESGV